MRGRGAPAARRTAIVALALAAFGATAVHGQRAAANQTTDEGRQEAAPAAASPAGSPRVVAGGPYRVVYWPRQERLADRILERALRQTPLPGLPPAALPGTDTVHIVLAPSQALWDSITGNGVPEWAAGIAEPSRALVVLPTFAWNRMSNADLYVTLRHELAHVALHRFVAPARVPRWVDEGYARWAAGEWDYSAVWQLRLAFLFQRTPPLDSLTLSWPAGEVNARIAYLLSTSAFEYLASLSGERGLIVLFQRWRSTASFDQALRSTYGLTLGQFEKDWIHQVKHRYAWPLFLAHSLIFWAFGGVLVLVLFLVRRRRDRAKLERLRATEPPDEPAFWLGDDATPPSDGPPGEGSTTSPDKPPSPVERERPDE